MTEPKPIFLFADSQLLFWKNNECLFLNRIRDCIDQNKNNIKAAYIGASNGDDPAYFDIFHHAMEQIEIINCRMIPSKPTTGDIDFLNLSDLILLAGGDVKKGWNIFMKNGLYKTITERYYEGAVIIGVSAGAVQLGLKGGYYEDNQHNLIDTFKIVPFIIDVHDERNEWENLKINVKNGNDYCKGFGIPSGGGAIFYPDWSMEAVRHSLTEVFIENNKVKYSLIIPPKDVNISNLGENAHSKNIKI